MAQSTNATNPWFGVSMFLFGAIVGGLLLASMTGADLLSVGSRSPSPVAEANNPPPAPAPTPTAPATADNLPEIDFDRDHIRGPQDAAIFVVEYSDYECPFCSRLHPTLVQLLENNDDVAWVYRHFPLSFHPNATPLAEASECVWEQGGNDAFWAFTDMIFEKGADASKITEYADAAGVNGSQVQDCVDSGKYADYVANDMAGGSQAGVSGTPGNVVINIDSGETRLVSGAQPVSAFQAAVDALR